MLPKTIFSDMKKSFADTLGIRRGFDTSCNILLITGSNASGKSFLRRFVSAILHQDDIECIQLSQEGRGQEGLARAFMYGDESWQSTGCISAKTFKGAFVTSRKREKKHVLLWDEPEIGMGEELQLGVALQVKKEMENIPSNLLGIIFMTHSRIFVREFMKMENSKFFNLNGYNSSNDWLNREILPVDLECFDAICHQKFLRLTKLLGKS